MRFPSAGSALLLIASYINVRETYAEAAAVATDADQAIDYTQIDLTELSNDELVAICTDRGFELVFELDDATEEPLEYSHEDYVDAARECLKLEAEMEFFYDENPDMLKEMEEERERMMKEQEELERKLKEAQEKLDTEKAKRTSDGSNAFVKKAEQEEEEETDEDETDAPPRPDTSKKINQKIEMSSDDEIIDLDDDIMNEVIEESQKEKAEQSVDDMKEDPSEAQNDTPTSISSATDDGLIIEFKEVYAEFCAKVKQDFETIANIVVPKPLRGPLKDGLNKGYTIAKNVSIEIFVKVKSSGLYTKVKEDVIRIFDILVPQSARGPLREGVKTSVKMAKDGAIKGADLAKRYGSALLEKGMTTYKKIQQEQEERKRREQQEAAEGTTS